MRSPIRESMWSTCTALPALAALLLAIPSLSADDSSGSHKATPARAVDGDLRRRPMFGAQFVPVTREVRIRQKLDGDDGVVVEKVFPGTSAAEAKLEVGDVIVASGGRKITDVPMFLRIVECARAGDVLTLDVVHDGMKIQVQVTPEEAPREKGDGYDCIYDHVTSHGARLRTIITRPNAKGRHPAVMLLQGGHTCFSIDNPVGPPFGFTWVARNLARRGYVTMRVERPGCGDSEGGPFRDVDFDTELDGYKDALRALKQLDFVDADNVFLFGHSQGGVNAPLMAVEIPVRGIAVYGTVLGAGIEGMLGQRRRMAMLDGTNPADVDREVNDQARFWYPLLVEKKTPLEIHKEYSDLPKRIWEQWVSDHKYVAGRHYKYYHQGADKNLAEAWSKVAAIDLPVPSKTAPPNHPRVLSIWGTSDWLVDRAGNAWIADIVNRVTPGNGTFVALDSIDHFFLTTSTAAESYRYFKPAKGMPPTSFNGNILDTLLPWLDETAGRPKIDPEKTENPGAPDKRLRDKIDQLFAEWDKPDSPGFVLGVVRDGKLVYTRGYGIANLDEGTPLSSQSVLQVWSLTKAFTTQCVAFLLDQGKIALDDPVTKFVPEMPSYDPPIRIRHLLQCTSGLHDYYLTMQLAGWSWRDAWTQDNVLDLLSRRKSLAIKPGEKFQYSNSDYFLLGLITERASGQSLHSFAHENLFGPLDMRNTFFSDDSSVPVRHRATGYERRPDGRFYRSMIQSNTVGAFDLKTTVEDLVRWEQGYDGHRLKDGPFANAFRQLGHLDNRRVVEAYAQETYKGLPRNWYTGGGPGFFAQMLRFPEQRLCVILLCNLAEEKEWQAMTRNIQQIADLFLGDHLKPVPPKALRWDPDAKAVNLPLPDLREKAGLFRDPGGLFQRVMLKDGRLWWLDPFQHAYALVPVSPSRFRSLNSPLRLDVEFVKPKPDGSLRVKIIDENGKESEWQAVKPVAPAAEELAEYAGKFHCEELDTVYDFAVQDSALTFRINKGSKRLLLPMCRDVFIPANRLQADWVFTFERDARDRITGFRVDFARAANIRFQKTSDD